MRSKESPRTSLPMQTIAARKQMQIPRRYVHGAENSRRKDTRPCRYAGRLVTVAQSHSMTGAHAPEVTEGTINLCHPTPRRAHTCEVASCRRCRAVVHSARTPHVRGKACQSGSYQQFPALRPHTMHLRLRCQPDRGQQTHSRLSISER